MDFESKFNGAGGTPGGLREFFIGLIMTVAGAYLLTNQVTVTSSFWTIYGHNAFGLTLVPLVLGIGIFVLQRQINNRLAAAFRRRRGNFRRYNHQLANLFSADQPF